MADRLALVCDVYLCFVTFPSSILVQVLYLVVSIPDLCYLSYFDIITFHRNWYNLRHFILCQSNILIRFIQTPVPLHICQGHRACFLKLTISKFD